MMKKIAGAAVLMMGIIFILHFTVKMVTTIDMSAVNGTAMENISHSLTTWSTFSTSFMTPAVLIIAIGTVIMAVYALITKGEGKYCGKNLFWIVSKKLIVGTLEHYI